MTDKQIYSPILQMSPDNAVKPESSHSSINMNRGLFRA